MHSFLTNNIATSNNAKQQQQNNVITSQQPNFQMPTSLSQIFTMPQFQQQQQIFQMNQQQQQGLVIPHGFQGTIVFQPTIHVHSKKTLPTLDDSKYRKIIPKGTTPKK